MNEAYGAAQRGQRLAADPNASVFVTANAGSGKTKVLIDRVARLLLAGGQPSAFLCITYTKAAAAEMQRRLFDRLGGWCVMDDAALSAELTDLIGPTADLGRPALARARALFAQALETPGGLRIQTIHAFCERLLRRFPLEAGVAPGFEVADDAQTAKMIAAAWAHAAEREPAALAHFAEKLHADALEQLLSTITNKRAPFGAYLKSAGGIGAARAHLRARHGARTDRQSFVRDFLAAIPWTQWDQACAALKEGSAADGTCADGICAARKADDKQFSLYCAVFLTDEATARKNMAGKLRKTDPFLDRLLRQEQARVVAACAALKAIDRAADAAALLALGDALLGEYGRAKARIGVLDFDDLIERAQALLGRAESAPWVLYKLDYGIEHILIDEGQDTSPAQWTLIEPLQREFFSGLGVHARTRTMFAVGDPKQSIYSFQGADPDRFLAEAQKLAQRAAAAEHPFQAPQLSMSFRSAQTILDAVDATFAGLAKSGPEFSGGPASRHVAKRAGEDGLVEWWPLAQKPERAERQPWRAPLDAQSGATATGLLANTIAAQVAKWISQGETVWDKGIRRPMRAGDVLTLVRKRGAVFDDTLRAFKAAGLDVAGADRMTLKEELAVEDLLALARVALDANDDLSLACALKGPFIGLEEDDLLDLAAPRAEETRLIVALRAAANPAHVAASAYVDDLIKQSAAAPYEFFARILETTDTQGRSGWRRMLGRLGLAAKDPVEELLARAQAIGDRGAPTLQHLLAEIESDDAEIKREMETESDCVRVMTVHGAKGLEAPVVILADTTGVFEGRDASGLMIAGEEIFWSPGKTQDDCLTAEVRTDLSEAAKREHFRLLYVAMTRARDRLIVCGAALGNRKEGRAEESWHELVERGLERAGAMRCETPFGEGFRLGAPHMAAAAEARPHPPAQPAPAWARTKLPPEAAPARSLAPSQFRLDEPPAFSARADGRRRFRRGRLIHWLLERLPDVAGDQRAAAAAGWLKGRGASDEEAAALTSEALRVLDHPDFAAVFAPGSRAEAPVVGVLPNGRRVAGAVDRLAVNDQEVLALDFKTDRPAPARSADIPAAYVAQLAAYAVVLQAAFPGRAIRCALLWTEAPRLMEIPGDMLAAAAARLA